LPGGEKYGNIKYMARPTNHQRRYKNVGRKLKIDATILQKLEDAFSNALPDSEACFYAGIAPATLYNYQKRNPEFIERKEALKLTPNIAARKTVVSTLNDVRIAQWWLEKKDPEMKPASKIEHFVEVIDSPDIEMSEDELAAFEALRTARRKRIEKQAREKTK